MTRRDIDADNATRESGSPGGGGGRKDEVGRSGVYPASGPYPEGNAEFRGQASWGQGERGLSKLRVNDLASEFGISTEEGGTVLNRGLIDYKEGFGARAVVHDFYELDVSHGRGGDESG